MLIVSILWICWQTDSKVVAEQVESELLAVFDYAWNKGSNGSRRSRDILAKLFMAWPTNDSLLCSPFLSNKKYLFCGTNAVGIKVALRKPQDATSSKSNKSLGYLQTGTPAQVPVRSPVKVASLELRCGVITDHGTPCNTPPVKGRKRCLQHKGMRVRGAPLLQATEDVKRESVKVGGGSICLPRFGRSRRVSLAPTTTDSKPDEPGERRRPLSLSFNTWMKMENDRVSQEPPWIKSNEEPLYTDISFHKHVNAIPKPNRVRQIRSKYTPVLVDDTTRG